MYLYTCFTEKNVGIFFQGSVNILLTTMAAIDFLVLLCSLLFIGLPNITENLIRLHEENSHVTDVAKTTGDWLNYMVSYRFDNYTVYGGDAGSFLVKKMKTKIL